MNSLSSSVANSTYNLNSSQKPNESMSFFGAGAIAATILLSTFGAQGNVNHNPLTTCIERSNKGIIVGMSQQLEMKARVIGMVTQEFSVPTLVADVIAKMNNFVDVVNISHNIQSDTKSVEFFVSVFMPKYNRDLMRSLIALEVEAENIADKYNYVLNFEYIPVNKLSS